MNKIFSSVFSKPTDKPWSDSGYFYHVPWYEKEHSLAYRAKINGISEEEFLEKWEKRVWRDFSESWQKRLAVGEFDEAADNGFAYYLKGRTRDPLIGEIMDKIIREKIPFMDIASSGTMGLAPYLLHENPDIPCLIADIDPYTMRALRRCLDAKLPEYSIEVASFDNLDMPVKDHSFEYITSIGAIVYSYVEKTTSEDLEKFAEQCQYSLLREVYRILKPGGRFITVESNAEFRYDLDQVFRYFETHDKFLGLYTKDVVISKLEQLEEYLKKHQSINEIMKNVGFQIETVKTYGKQLSERMVAQFFSPTGDFEIIGEHGPEDNELIKNIYNHTIYVLHKPNIMCI